jgi:hypothetical protein
MAHRGPRPQPNPGLTPRKIACRRYGRHSKAPLSTRSCACRRGRRDRAGETRSCDAGLDVVQPAAFSGIGLGRAISAALKKGRSPALYLRLVDPPSPHNEHNGSARNDGVGGSTSPSACEGSPADWISRNTRSPHSSRMRAPAIVVRADSKSVSRSWPSSAWRDVRPQQVRLAISIGGFVAVVPATPVRMERRQSMRYRRLPAAQPDGTAGYAPAQRSLLAGGPTAPSALPKGRGTQAAAVLWPGSARRETRPCRACRRSCGGPSGRGGSATP